MSNSGTLSVRVFTSNAQLPVEGATVVIMQEGTGDRRELLSLQVTDSSGLIQPITIPTPAPGESTAPLPIGDPSVPYALCSVWAERAGFAMLQVEGIQIFPGVETMQNMRLTPLSMGENSLQQRDLRDITPQNL